MANDKDYTNTSDMLNRLEGLYPNELPKHLIGDLQLAFRQGQQKVIQDIRDTLNTQERRNQG